MYFEYIKKDKTYINPYKHRSIKSINNPHKSILPIIYTFLSTDLPGEEFTVASGGRTGEPAEQSCAASAAGSPAWWTAGHGLPAGETLGEMLDEMLGEMLGEW